MATCKFCNAENLQWIGDGVVQPWRLHDEKYQLHKCSEYDTAPKMIEIEKPPEDAFEFIKNNYKNEFKSISEDDLFDLFDAVTEDNPNEQSVRSIALLMRARLQKEKASN